MTRIALCAATAFAALGLAAGTAAAQLRGEDKPAPEPKAGTPMSPKPAPELAVAAKTLAGRWRCVNQQAGPPMGSGLKLTTTIVWKVALDGFWLDGSYAEAKAKNNPMPPYKFTEHRTWDAGAKQWIAVAVDNMGGLRRGTVIASADGKTTWLWEANMGGMSFQVKVDEEIAGKTMKATGQGSMDGKTWAPLFAMECKK